MPAEIGLTAETAFRWSAATAAGGPACRFAAGAGGGGEAALPALEAAADNPEGSFTSAAPEAARSRAAGAAEEEPACCDTTGPGVEKREASPSALKAAAGNPEGSFTPAAAGAVMCSDAVFGRNNFILMFMQRSVYNVVFVSCEIIF